MPLPYIGTVVNLSCAGGQSEWHGMPSLNSMDMKINEYTYNWQVTIEVTHLFLLERRSELHFARVQPVGNRLRFSMCNIKKIIRKEIENKITQMKIFNNSC
ncbi:hypothetical protein DN390_30495 [Bacillus sp. SH7-1]|nr:hypothetical protein DN390_30495 [Bacillus sp. SH7-1]